MWFKKKSETQLSEQIPSAAIVPSTCKIENSDAAAEEDEKASLSSSSKRGGKRIVANPSNDLSEDETRDDTTFDDGVSYSSSGSSSSSDDSGEVLADDDDFMHRLSLNDPSLTEVDISLGYSNEELCKEFTRALSTNYHLKVLTLAGDERQMARTKLVSSLSSALGRNTSIETLEIRDAVLSRRTSLALGVAISQNKSIQSLKLSNCVFNDTACSVLFLGVQHSSTVQKIDIKACNLSGLALDCISVTVSLMNIKQLRLERTMLNFEGLKFLCENLHLNEQLEEIDLSHNHFGSQEAKTIASYLKTSNHQLKAINLGSCGLDDVSVNILSKAFVESNSLQKINLSRNKFTSAGARTLKSALEQNSNILEMNVSGNKISSKKKMGIDDAIRVNNSCLKSICNFELSLQILDAMDMCCSLGKN